MSSLGEFLEGRRKKNGEQREAVKSLDDNAVSSLKNLRDRIRKLQGLEKEQNKLLGEVALERGKRDGKGNRAIRIGGWTYFYLRVTSESIDEKKLRKLCKRRGLAKPYVMVPQFDEDLYMALPLTDEERDAVTIRTEHYRSSIKPPKGE